MARRLREERSGSSERSPATQAAGTAVAGTVRMPAGPEDTQPGQEEQCRAAEGTEAAGIAPEGTGPEAAGQRGRPRQVPVPCPRAGSCRWWWWW